MAAESSLPVAMTMYRPWRSVPLLGFLLFCVFVDVCHGYDTWWNLGVQGGVDVWAGQRAYIAGAQPGCSHVRGLSPGQRRICQLYPDHMASVSEGAQTAIRECQWQLFWRRWNCSTVENDTSVFGPTLNSASRENAFVHAISSAGVVFAVSRACREGQLSNCGCSRQARPKQLNRDWLWGGCGDNTEYGYRFAVGFVDAREKEKNHPRHSKALSIMLMNIHNNEAGRRAVSAFSKPACKCHGVSGSCSMKTCWNQLPSFREIGDHLLARYDAATEVKFNRPGTFLVGRGRAGGGTGPRRRPQRTPGRPARDQLIYVDQSPDYCTANPETGWEGTHGRRCQRSVASGGGMESCDLMCCGRGYNSFRTTVTERCNCKFHWCCYVKCDTCEQSVDTYICK